MVIQPRRSALRELHALAQGQAGYFTAKQAARVGFGYSHLTYHVKAGNIERAGHGLYRLALIPVSEHDDLVRLVLWSRNQRDEPQAVVSHATALVLHGLTDLLPGAVHLTVPRRFQKKAPREAVLHRADLTEDDIIDEGGFRATTALRTLLDAAKTAAVPQNELVIAVRTALERGLVRRSALAKAAKAAAGDERLMKALAEVERNPR